MGKKLELTNITIDKGESTKEYVIYGYGIVGRMLRKVLEKLNQKINCFVCSDGYKTKNNVDGLPLCEISNYAKNRSDKEIILVTVQRGVENVLEILQYYEKNDIVMVNSAEDFDKIYRGFYKEYFQEKGVDLSKEFMDLKGIKFLNPFKNEISYSTPFFSECGDLVLPAVYNDLSNVFEGPYEYENVVVEKDDVVIDCGSNMGLFSIAVANRCKKIYAFEPSSKAQEYILEAAKVYSNIQLCKYALGDYVGQALFAMSENESYSNSIVKKGMENEGNILVDITTIDEFVRVNNIERIDYIKADIEGAERDMLRGAKETLKRFAPKLSICEYHLSDDPEVLEQIILEANPNYVIKHDYMKLYAYVPNRSIL